MQMFLGCSTDMCLQMVKNGYGTVQTGCMTVLDSDAAKVSLILKSLPFLWVVGA